MVYELSQAAANDVEEILEYSYQKFGDDKTVGTEILIVRVLQQSMDTERHI